MITSLHELAQLANYSLLDTLTPDPNATKDGADHAPREVFSGHYVPVLPTPIPQPKYIAHSPTFFHELGLDDALATDEQFMRLFTGDTTELPEPLRKFGWATGYALSIYGTEYYEQCPFKTGNGYGDGRALSVLETLIQGKRWEMQLKGGGKTPYCRGADGRAVLRSSVREFLAQEHMHALGVPTSRSLTLYTSSSEKVRRPWFRDGSYSKDPEVMIEEDVAITTRVAPSFLRVGQLELFGRRARKNEHPNAMNELEQMVRYIIVREYSNDVDQSQPLSKQILQLAKAFRERLASLVANWIRVGYCQGNFNSDNCAVGGFTLDYGPFGFMDDFNPQYQPWTGGGEHFSFLNQPQAAEYNFQMFCKALLPLLQDNADATQQLNMITIRFSKVMQEKMTNMWATKLGLANYDADLFKELIILMLQTSVDYTIFFRELSHIPETITPLTKSFYSDAVFDEALVKKWESWFASWKSALDIDSEEKKVALRTQMLQSNPKYTLREWFLVPAYQLAEQGDYSLLQTLQQVMNHPYDEQSTEIEETFYKEKPEHLFNVAGVSHVSCSS